MKASCRWKARFSSVKDVRKTVNILVSDEKDLSTCALEEGKEIPFKAAELRDGIFPSISFPELKRAEGTVESYSGTDFLVLVRACGICPSHATKRHV